MLYRALYTVFIIIVAVLGLLLLATTLPIPGNIQVRMVESGSMEPAIKTGSLVVIKPKANYAVGDIITFGPAGSVPTTHRVVEINEVSGGVSYATRGDANDVNDTGATPKSEVIGEVVLSVPYFGYLIRGAQEPIGFALLVILPALIIIFEEAGKIVREVRRVSAAPRSDEAEI